MSIKSIKIHRIGDSEETSIEFGAIGKPSITNIANTGAEPHIESTTVVNELGEMVDNAATMLEKFIQLQKPNCGGMTVGETQDLVDEAEKYVKDVERMRE